MTRFKTIPDCIHKLRACQVPVESELTSKAAGGGQAGAWQFRLDVKADRQRKKSTARGYGGGLLTDLAIGERIEGIPPHAHGRRSAG